MTRTLLDLDDEALAEAMHALGTNSKVATVNAALRQTAATERARAAGHDLMQALVDNPDFGSPEVMHGAWCHADLAALEHEHDATCDDRRGR